MILFLLSCGMMSACADVKGPTWLTGEPDDTVLNAPRVVGRPTTVGSKTWPNLAEVPETKPKFMDMKVRDDEARQLKSDNLKAQAEMERIRNIPLEDDRTREQEMTTGRMSPLSSSFPAYPSQP